MEFLNNNVVEGMTGIEPASSAWKAEVLATIRHSHMHALALTGTSSHVRNTNAAPSHPPNTVTLLDDHVKCDCEEHT